MKKIIIIKMFSNRYELWNEEELKKLATIYSHDDSFLMIDLLQSKFFFRYKIGD